MIEVDIIDGNISKEIVFNSFNEWIFIFWDVCCNELLKIVIYVIVFLEKYVGY